MFVSAAWQHWEVTFEPATYRSCVFRASVREPFELNERRTSENQFYVNLNTRRYKVRSRYFEKYSKMGKLVTIISVISDMVKCYT